MSRNRILFVGDVVGSAGRRVLLDVLPGLVQEFAPSFVVVNAENAAAGKGITPRIADDLFAAGVDAITLGNDFEISEYNRDDLIYDKEMLLKEPVKKVPVADRSLYDTPIPYYRSHS